MIMATANCLGVLEEASEMETDIISINQVIEMDVDLSDEQTIIAELHSCRLNLQVTLPTLNDKEFCGLPVETCHVNYSDFLYLVLDTNVLLSHLKFLKELKDHSIKDIGKPVLIIPWIVIQELDTLKNSSGSVGTQSQSATHFINDCLSVHHPRVRGQTIEEVNTELDNLAISNNDDRILHCCLVYQQKMRQQNVHGLVVLFSNDTMLCAKAKINNIIACNRKTLLTELKSLSGNHGVISYTQTQEYIQKVGQQLQVDDQIRLLDDCLSQAEGHTRDALSVIIDHEMREVYGDLSTDIMSRKPPWNLEDAVHMLDKHWIAVFSFTFSGSHIKIRKLVDQLQDHIQQRLKTLSNVSVVTFINSALGILEHFRNKPEVWSRVSLSVASLKVLCDKVSLSNSQTPQPVTTPTSPALPPVVTTSPVAPPTLPHLSVTLQQLISECPPNPLNQMYWIFQIIRESVVNGIIATQTALTNGFFNRHSELQLIELLKYLEELILTLEGLVTQGLLIPIIRTLHQSLQNYLAVIVGVTIPLTQNQLCDLCQCDGILNTFHEALSFMMDGRYQLACLLHQATQT